MAYFGNKPAHSICTTQCDYHAYKRKYATQQYNDFHKLSRQSPPLKEMNKRNNKIPDQPIRLDGKHLLENKSDFELDQMIKVPSVDDRNKNDKYLFDGNKMLWHLDRYDAFKKGERFAPVHIDQGLSKGCNIACHFCYGVTQGNFYKKGSERIFERNALLNNYLKSAGEVGVRSIALIGEADPTLNPNLYDAIVVGKNSGISMSIATNGILWDTSKKGEAALENLEWMRFHQK